MANHAELLAGIPLFARLDEDEWRTLLAAFEPMELAEGAVLFQKGDPGGVLYVVVAGHVVSSVTDDQGKASIVGDHEAGDVVGELSLLDGGPRSVDARALEHSQLVALDRGGLLDVVARHPHVALDLLTVVGSRLRAAESRSRFIRNANVEEDERLSFGDRVADRVAEFGGSWKFIFTSMSILLCWIALNIILVTRAFDPYPFILLNLVLSALAALQAPVIMMSQNRQAAKDRIRSDLDYEIDRRAELEIAHLHRKMDDLYAVLARLQSGPQAKHDQIKDSCHGS